MVFPRAVIKGLTDVRFINLRSFASTSTRPTKTFIQKHKQVDCPYGIAKNETKLIPEETAKKENTYKEISVAKPLTNEQKMCPKFCTYLEKDCPPLVPPITKPFGLNTGMFGGNKNQIPIAAVWAYHLLKFGAKLGIAAYCIKWTYDKGLWGTHDKTNEIYNNCSDTILHVFPQLNAICESNQHGTITHYWNRGVVITFDSILNFFRYFRTTAINKEHQLLSPLVINEIGQPQFITKSKNHDEIKSQLHLTVHDISTSRQPDADIEKNIIPEINFTEVIQEPKLNEETDDETEETVAIINQLHEYPVNKIDPTISSDYPPKYEQEPITRKTNVIYVKNTMKRNI